MRRPSDQTHEGGDPIRVGIVGAGYMGSGLMNAVERARGMRVTAIHDPDASQARRVAEMYAPTARAARDLSDVCAAEDVDVVVDGTPDPALGVACAMTAFDAGKHVVSINIECDVTVGAALARRARDAGLVYTVISGDEPGELKALYDHYDALGFRVVALGKGKNNPLDVSGNPDSVGASLPDNGITAEQVASFVDGSKTMFEMGCTAKAIGFVPDVDGMHGPECAIADLAKTFRTSEQGGILSREGVVDFVTGRELSGGVWIVVWTDDARTRSDFAYLKIGAGPYYAFYQRYHNWFVDAPLSIARAVRQGRATIAPLETATCQVVALAKRDLPAGRVLDGIGGFDTYGVLVTSATAMSEELLPMGLAAGAATQRDLQRGHRLRLADVTIPETPVSRLWQAMGVTS